MAESQKNQTEKENIVELKTNIYLLSIIGEVEGHESLGERTKATRYEHILPALARAEEDKSIDGLLILLNTVGGDVEAGLAIAEMIASMRKPAVSLVLGGGHSIGVPLAVAADYSLIVPSATMVIHPVRTNGMFIGVAQTYRNMEKTQDRITGFVSAHSKITERLEELMLDTKMLVKRARTTFCLLPPERADTNWSTPVIFVLICFANLSGCRNNAGRPAGSGRRPDRRGRRHCPRARKAE